MTEEQLTPMDQPPDTNIDVAVALKNGSFVAAYYNHADWALRTYQNGDYDEEHIGLHHGILKHCLGYRRVQKGDTFTAIDLDDYANEPEGDPDIPAQSFDNARILELNQYAVENREFIGGLQGKAAEVERRLTGIMESMGETDEWVERIGGNLDKAEDEIAKIHLRITNMWGRALIQEIFIIAIVAVVGSLFL